ncbi:outer membrane biosynthesis protein TonB [Sphingomonas naasensis]|uniref:Carboxypeptidase regulatory-like domain-containing protein n=1 Tax=Sphingomonas naasensis TaxID=1344951 RepID=A0A4S1WMM4_9SPHN|nr:carboxypeptidase-like regulatory domain-containing protein [Sphingomonas naasensis]NIJ20417.1 outer membrane biosynthesis protein TonB [Sphingomonas naasensis]TGX44521.1 carboxypeptidase regulatory-like domain-containing protein [Sphingomonas naasensis]
MGAMLGTWAIAPAAQQQPTPNVLEGHIVDDKGKPIEGAEVYATFQSNPGQHVSRQLSTKSGPDGYYSITFNSSHPVGTWSASAQADYGNWRLSLLPSSDAVFAGNAGAIRDFRLAFVEKAPGFPYGIGGKVRIDHGINQFFKFENVTLTLQPVGGGQAVTRTLREMDSSGFATGLRPGPYKISAAIGASPVLLSTDLSDGNFKSSYTGDFTPVMSDIYEIHLYAKASSGGSAPPPGDPAPVPFPDTDDGFTRTGVPPQDLGNWQVRSTRVFYRPTEDGTTPNVVVAFYARNNALLPQIVDSSFRLALNGASTYAPTGMQYQTNAVTRSPAPAALISSIVPLTPQSRSLKIGEEVAVYASFRVDPAALPALKSAKITAISKAGPLLKVNETSTTIALPAAPPTSGQKPRETPTPAPAPTPPPAPTPTPTPAPTPAPAPTPDTSGDPIPVQGSVSNLGRWSVRVTEVHYKTPTSMTVSITARNRSVTSLSPLSVLDFTLQGRGATAAKHVTYGQTFPVKALQEVVMTAWFDLPRADQEAVNAILVKELAQPKQGLLVKAQPETSVRIPVQPRAKASTPPDAGKTSTPAPAPAPTPTPAPAPTPAPRPTPAPAKETTTTVGGGFRNTGYLFTRLDAVRRGADGAVEVTFTMRNDQNVRRSIWNNDNSWTLIGSDGLSYKFDGNDYGRDSSDRRTTSTWLEKGDANVITYVYRKVPAGVKPARLIVRDYYGKIITEYDLASGVGTP